MSEAMSETKRNANVDLVEAYLEAVASHDWDRLAGCLAEDVVRVGPFGDTYGPRSPYIAFLTKLMPSLENYSMSVGRIVAFGATVLAELTESMQWDGKMIDTPEALVFDVDKDERIERIVIYIQRLS